MLRDFNPQDILDDLYGPEDEFAPPPTPASASAAAAALRRDEAARKREERARRRAAGIPDPRVVDAAITSALAEVLRTGGAVALLRKSRSFDTMRVLLRPVLATAMRSLVDRGIDKAVAAHAVRAKLFPDMPTGPTPST